MTYTATVSSSVSPAPTGTVDFWSVPSGSSAVMLGTAPVSQGQALLKTTGQHVGSDTVYAVYQGDSTHAGSEDETTHTINPAPLSITADNKSANYGGLVPALTFTAVGFVNGDTASSLPAQPTCTTQATLDGAGNDISPVGTYSISCSGQVDPDYVITYTPGTLTISPGPLTITASSPTMKYGQAPVIQPMYSGLASSDSSPKTPPTCTTTAKQGSGVGTYATSCSGANDANYNISYVPGTLTIQPTLLKIIPTSFSVAYGTELPQLNWSANFVNGDTPTSLTAQPTCATTVSIDSGGAVTSPAGAYPIHCSGASAANYTVGYGQGTATVVLAHVSLAYAGPKIVARGKKAILAAYILSSASKPIVGRSLTINLRGGASATAQQCFTPPSNSEGYASCQINRVKQPKGTARLQVTFTGDERGPNYDYASDHIQTQVKVK